MEFLKQAWHRQSITVKLVLAFAMLFSLQVIVAFTSGFALLRVNQHFDSTQDIRETERQISEINSHIKEARYLQNQYFSDYPALGTASAYELYGLPAIKFLEHVVSDSQNLRESIAEPQQIASILQYKYTDINVYLLAIERQKDMLYRGIELVNQLADPQDGLETQFHQISTSLLKVLAQDNRPELMSLYWEMRYYEVEYFNTRQRSALQAAFNQAIELKDLIAVSETIDAKELALQNLDDYITLGEQINSVDVALYHIYNDFNLQIATIDPIADDITTLIQTEMELSQKNIGQANLIAFITLALVNIITGTFSILAALLLHRSITRNILSLNDTTSELRFGHLSARTSIVRYDELGELAKTFNMMAERIEGLVVTLEDRKTELESSNQRLEEEITERKRAESNLFKHNEQLEAILAASQDLLFVLDLEQHIVDYRTDTPAMLYTSPNVFLGKQFQDILPPEIGEQFRKTIEKVQETGIRQAIEYPLQMPHLDEESWFEATISNTDEQMIIVVQDITARRLSEQQKLQVELEQKRTQIMAHFMNQASHEFRTPLAAIKTSVYLLGKTDDMSKQGQYILKIEDRINELADLVDALITLSDLDSLMELKVSEVNVCQILEQVIHEQQNRLNAKHIQCDFQFDEWLPVYGNDVYLAQALIYLIDNAICFTPLNGMISISTVQIEDKIQIEIKDTGTGISKEDLPHIFERFYRADKAGTTRGLGLGLPSARRIIELHQGQIEVESQAGQGSVFRIVLPALLEKHQT